MSSDLQSVHPVFACLFVETVGIVALLVRVTFWSGCLNSPGVCRIMRLCSLMRLDPSQWRTHGQGVDQSTGPLQGVTQDGAREGRPRSLRDWESLIIIVTVSHTLATQRHRQSALALGVWWVTFSLSFHPSISRRFISHLRTQACFLSHSQSPILFVSAVGIFVMLSSSRLSITAVLASPVILVPARGAGMSSFLFQPSPHPTPGSRTHSCSEEQQKNFDVRQEPKPCE